MHVLHVVGARPNFMKAAPVLRALALHGCTQTLVHTGQHYDSQMSDCFFSELGIPAPDANLNVGPGTHAQQTSQIMSRFEPVLASHSPDMVLVYGDVNSTVAAALVCAKAGYPVSHVEAGLRSFDRGMPEEINRVVTDHLSEFLFTPSPDADENLCREGIPADRILLVGNVMIDTLVHLLPAANKLKLDKYPDRYALVTLHRPSNVDDIAALRKILEKLTKINSLLPVVFPLHPRTRSRLEHSGFDASSLCITDPLPYIEFLALQQRATVVITDSGGIQEETTFLGVPCLTFRANTERPVTITLGTNVLVGTDPESLFPEVLTILSGSQKKGTVPPLWDGHAADRIAEALLARCCSMASAASA